MLAISRTDLPHFGRDTPQRKQGSQQRSLSGTPRDKTRSASWGLWAPNI
jgi:hypothetical protein